MIHPNLLFVSSGSWEVGNLRCENIDRDQISPKFLKPPNAKTLAGIKFPQNSQNLSNYAPALPIFSLLLGKDEPALQGT